MKKCITITAIGSLLLLCGCAQSGNPSRTSPLELPEEFQTELPEKTPIPTSGPVAVPTETPDLTAQQRIELEAEANRKISGLVRDGEFTGSAVGKMADIQVTVTVRGGLIRSIQIEEEETTGLGDRAASQVAERIIRAQSVNVDNLGGATISSKAVKEAVAQALEQAKELPKEE